MAGRSDLESLLAATREPDDPPSPGVADYSQGALLPADTDFRRLPSGTLLTSKYLVEERLGKPGSFGVVYKVIDTLGDVPRALKLILHDRFSTLERLKKEYRTLLHVPPHAQVVRVIYADVLPGGPPFIVFEFVEGLDVGEMAEAGLFAPEDALTLLKQTAAGLAHLHRHGVYHCDIKPHNLLWTDKGVRIIDFNVSVRSGDEGGGGGSERYLPPDLDRGRNQQPQDLVDRDLFALGVTAYQALTGRYPWEGTSPPPGRPPLDPRELTGFADLAPGLTEVLLKAIAPHRNERFASAVELLEALEGIQRARQVPRPPAIDRPAIGGLAGGEPDRNPFVDHLVTLYSQSHHSNAGTRGLDEAARQTYVETALDRDLAAAVLAGEFRLVIISGNAGDGKTAFLQQLETRAEAMGARLDHGPVNGCRFTLDGRDYLSNYDGSQDEGGRDNREVLRDFFAPFAGDNARGWPRNAVRLIAINEGRLVDFLATEGERFQRLAGLVQQGLAGGKGEAGVAVVNLNLRSVVSAAEGFDGSILERLIRRICAPELWQACAECRIATRCYARHNALTLLDPTAGPKVIERLRTLYELTHLRGRLHITLRDLRSALSFMLLSGRDCREIQALYDQGAQREIVQGFYFNAWMGGDAGGDDRLLNLLEESDLAHGGDPALDRALDFVSPERDQRLFRFENRGDLDREILRDRFEHLPRDFSGRPSGELAAAHRDYVGMLRRRYFFERRDDGWRAMLPYPSARRMLGLIHGEEAPDAVLAEILRAINRGEGLNDSAIIQGGMALQVREVERGTIRSYRLFPVERLSLQLRGGEETRFVETMPAGLLLSYRGESVIRAELPIDLDVFEMLMRLNQGYRPSVEEQQGYYLSLSVFKNLLASAPYQEVLLTTSGHDFYRIERQKEGKLVMERT